MALTVRVDVGLMRGRELVALGRYPRTGGTGWLGPADRQAIEQAWHDVHAQSLAGRRVGELSDGERQRLLIAMALAQRPSLLLLDDPGAFLDVTARCRYWVCYADWPASRTRAW